MIVDKKIGLGTIIIGGLFCFFCLIFKGCRGLLSRWWPVTDENRWPSVI